MMVSKMSLSDIRTGDRSINRSVLHQVLDFVESVESSRGREHPRGDTLLLLVLSGLEENLVSRLCHVSIFLKTRYLRKFEEKIVF